MTNLQHPRTRSETAIAVAKLLTGYINNQLVPQNSIWYATHNFMNNFDPDKQQCPFYLSLLFQASQAT